MLANSSRRPLEPEPQATPHDKFDVYSNALMSAVGFLAEVVATADPADRMDAAKTLVALEKARLRHKGQLAGAREKPEWECDLEPLPDFTDHPSSRRAERVARISAPEPPPPAPRIPAPPPNGVAMLLNEEREPDITEEMIELQRQELAEERKHLRCPDWSPKGLWNTISDEDYAWAMELNGYPPDTVWTRDGPKLPAARSPSG